MTDKIKVLRVSKKRPEVANELIQAAIEIIEGFGEDFDGYSLVAWGKGTDKEPVTSWSCGEVKPVLVPKLTETALVNDMIKESIDSEE